MELQALVFKLSGKKETRQEVPFIDIKHPKIATLDDLSNGRGGGGGLPGNR